MSRATAAEASPNERATAAVARARRGFRCDVEGLISVLHDAGAGTRLLVPLAKSIEEVPVGVEQEVGEELSLTPHLLFDDDRKGYLPAFTEVELVARATDRLGWTTGDQPLEYCALPGAVVLELALSLVDGEQILGLLLNPLDETELILRRHEVASIAQGRALPLVGYVGEIPFGQDEKRLVAEMDGEPPAAIVSAIETVLRAAAGSSSAYALKRTFNAERDLEPHLTLNVLGTDDDTDRAELAGQLASALDGLLPPPGYIDILFDDPTLR